MAWNLQVVDGADKGRSFTLLDDGIQIIGSNRKHTDICLHDLYVARVHCEVQVDGSRVLVRPTDPSSHPVLCNGQKVNERELLPGDVFRIGNTFLRLGVLATEKPEEELEEVEEEVAEEVEEVAEEAEDYDLEVIDEADDSAPVAADRTTVEHRRPRSPEAAARPSSGKLPCLPLERMGELSGQQMAHYQIGPPLRSGPRSVVFRANDKKTGLVVALRVLSPQFPANDGEMQPFVKALRLVLPLRHRNLIALWNAGRNSPYCWIAMDYVEGESLAEVLQQLNPPGKFAWKYALRLGVHLARALNFVHHNRLAHGNVTPTNILIRGSDKVARLGDLMLARALEGSALDLATRKSRLLAELAYRSPEGTAGLSKADIVADIYSMGACMYARCTSRPPFQGRSVEETQALIHEGPLLALRQFQPAIPEAFEDIVARMLARSREERFRTPAEALAELESLAESEGVEV
jgi:pSer/pThr/pTyr-binding forkhead associated (FHA) protein